MTHLATPRHRFTDLNYLSLSFQLGSFSGDVLNWGFFEPRWWRNYLHAHSFFEICYAFEGRGTFRMLGTDHTVRKGDLFVAKPGEPHEIISSEDEPLGIYFWSYTLVPRAEATERAEGVDRLLSAFLESRRWVGSDTASLPLALELLTEEIAQRRPGYGQVIEGLLAKLLLDTARAVVDLPVSAELTGATGHQAGDVVVQQVVRYLRDNYHRPLSVRDIAVQVHLSERHVSRLFQQRMGESLMHYLAALRIETAAQLLLNPQLSIRAVAEASGYPDVPHFTALFRRHTGLTPGAFRKRGGTQFLTPNP